MIAAITIMDEETGKIFAKDQLQPITTYENAKDMTVTYRWDFKYRFAKELLIESEVTE